MRSCSTDGGPFYRGFSVTVQQREEDEPDTVDIEEDTEDVLSEEEMKRATAPTEPGLDTKRAPHRVRMPSKVEIIKAVDAVGTESIDVDEITRRAAAIPKTEDLDLPQSSAESIRSRPNATGIAGTRSRVLSSSRAQRGRASQRSAQSTTARHRRDLRLAAISRD